jgi:drug/metabolite transporter (DMT)-like permease
MFFCFIGVCGMTLFSTQLKLAPKESEHGEVLLGIGVVFVAGSLFSLNGVIVRYFKNVDSAVLMFYHGAFGLIITCLFILISAILFG